MWLIIGEISTPIARAQKKHHSIIHVQLYWSGRAFECIDDDRTFHLSKNDKTPQCGHGRQVVSRIGGRFTNLTLTKPHLGFPV